jgi:hypothetical protein
VMQAAPALASQGPRALLWPLAPQPDVVRAAQKVLRAFASCSAVTLSACAPSAASAIPLYLPQLA